MEGHCRARFEVLWPLVTGWCSPTWHARILNSAALSGALDVLRSPSSGAAGGDRVLVSCTEGPACSDGQCQALLKASIFLLQVYKHRLEHTEIMAKWPLGDAFMTSPEHHGPVVGFFPCNKQWYTHVITSAGSIASSQNHSSGSLHSRPAQT